MMRMRRDLGRAAAAVVWVATAAGASAQCEPAWSFVEEGIGAGRWAHAMVYDSAREKLVIFGGWTQRSSCSTCMDPSGETWELEPWGWALKSDTGPSPRRGHAMAYDAGLGLTILHGGGYAGPISDDTWAWDGMAWTQLTTGPARTSAAMVFDAARGRVVLHGGLMPQGPSVVRSSETYEFDMAARVWTLVSSAGPARAWHAMAYDAARQRTVLFGGDAAAAMNDTWEWDGAAWEQKHPVTIPPGRSTHVMAYDEARGRVVMFGGYELRDTWEWDGVNWEQVASGGPGRRGYAVAAYDAANGRVVVHGGYITHSSSYTVFADTWAWLAAAAAADLNGDGIVDFSDYLEFLNLFDAQDPIVDFTGDGIVDFSDYLEFLNLFDAGC